MEVSEVTTAVELRGRQQALWHTLALDEVSLTVETGQVLALLARMAPARPPPYAS